MYACVCVCVRVCVCVCVKEREKPTYTDIQWKIKRMCMDVYTYAWLCFFILDL